MPQFGFLGLFKAHASLALHTVLRWGHIHI